MQWRLTVLHVSAQDVGRGDSGGVAASLGRGGVGKQLKVKYVSIPISFFFFFANLGCAKPALNVVRCAPDGNWLQTHARCSRRRAVETISNVPCIVDPPLYCDIYF